MAVRTAARRRVAEIIAEGKDPLDVLIDLAFNSRLDAALRIQAAAAAVPYVHPKLSAQVVDVHRRQVSDMEREEGSGFLIERLNALVGVPRTIEVEPEPSRPSCNNGKGGNGTVSE
ncbi:MAG: hypothetical protein JOZ58_15240 [Acetobacteraceae bacterium]|nr:hypothetical protein [Acetobacteraceae bacterium]